MQFSKLLFEAWVGIIKKNPFGKNNVYDVYNGQPVSTNWRSGEGGGGEGEPVAIRDSDAKWADVTTSHAHKASVLCWKFVDEL